MKLHTSPLFFFSIGLLCYGVYILSSSPAEYEYLEEKISGLIWISAGALSLLIYGIFRVTFKKRAKRQRIVEFILVSVILFTLYKKNGGHQFTLPHNYQGYVIILYGVDKAPKLKRPFYSNRTYVKIPSNGVVFTSSKRDQNYSHSSIFLDSTLGDIENLPERFKRFGLHYKSSTLTCYSDPHSIDIWVVGNTSTVSNDSNWTISLGKKIKRFVHHPRQVSLLLTRGLASWRLYEYVLIDITLLSDISN